MSSRGRSKGKRKQQTAAEISVSAAAVLELRRRRDLSHYAKKPIEFCKEILEIPHLTIEQEQILLSLRDRSETNVQASHGVGKSFISACAVVWWVFAVQGLAISTAPTANQVDQILWSEIRKMYDRHKGKLGGRRGELFLNLNEDARAYGFTARDYDSNAFQGRHAEKLLLIQDESCGISEEIDDGFAGCLTGAMNRGLRIGNPIENNTPFERACAKNHLRIPSWSHPNVAWAYELCEDGMHRIKPEIAAKILRPEDDPQRADDPCLPQDEWPPELPRDKIPGAVSINWIEKVRAKKGEGSAFWMSRVEGLFATDSESSIIPRSYFLAARARYDLNPQYWDELAAKRDVRHGLDVGDGGDDHALSRWRGPVLYAIEKEHTRGDMEDIDRAVSLGLRNLRANGGSICVDAIGVGSGALSGIRTKLREDDQDPDLAFGCKFGSKDFELYPGLFPDEDFTPQDMKCLLYWSLREAMRKGEVAIAPLGELEDELMQDWGGTYYEETNSCTRIEDKKLTRKRLHRSPDLGDAGIYGWCPAPERGFWAIDDRGGWSY